MSSLPPCSWLPAERGIDRASYSPWGAVGLLAPRNAKLLKAGVSDKSLLPVTPPAASIAPLFVTMVLQPKVYTFLCGCFAAFGSFLYGYDLGVIAGVLIAPNFLDVTNHPDETYLGFITSLLLLGAFCGSVPASIIADRYSRRSAIMAGAIVFIFGGSIQTAAQNREMMMAGRFFAGFGIGMLALLAPLYQSEIAHPSIRGRLTTLQQFFLGIGSFIASLAVYGCRVHHLGTAFEWRFPLGLQLMPAVPLATLIFFFPESPRWLMAQGREEDCLRSLARLHAQGDITDVFVVAEAAEVKIAVEHEKKVKSGWTQLFTDMQNFRKVLLGIILQFSVQMTGVSAIQYYSPTIFGMLGFSQERSLLFNCVSNIFALFGELCCVLFVDKVSVAAATFKGIPRLWLMLLFSPRSAWKTMAANRLQPGCGGNFHCWDGATGRVSG